MFSEGGLIEAGGSLAFIGAAEGLRWCGTREGVPSWSAREFQWSDMYWESMPVAFEGKVRTRKPDNWPCVDYATSHDNISRTGRFRKLRSKFVYSLPIEGARDAKGG